LQFGYKFDYYNAEVEEKAPDLPEFLQKLGDLLVDQGYFSEKPNQV
jgi:hypothetical protein